MNKYPTTEELAAEALETLRATPEDPKTLFRRLVERGWINANGEVTKLIGGSADPEPTHQANGNKGSSSTRQKNKK